jgi:hypothetical protein
MNNDDMVKAFLGMESEPNVVPTKDLTASPPASQMETIPAPKTRADEKAAPKFVMPDHKEPLEPQHPPVIVDITEFQEPTPVAPKLPEAVLEIIKSEKEYEELFNGTVNEVASMGAEDLMRLRHSMSAKIERIKIQQWAVIVTYEGKLKAADPKTRKKIQEADSEFWVARKEKNARKARATRSTGGNGEAKGDTGLTKLEKDIKMYVKLKFNEATIRKALTDTNTAVPENLAELITRFSQ